MQTWAAPLISVVLGVPRNTPTKSCNLKFSGTTKLNLFYTPLKSINDEQNKIAFRPTMRLLHLFGKFQMHVNGAHKYALLQSHNFNTLN